MNKILVFVPKSGWAKWRARRARSLGPGAQRFVAKKWARRFDEGARKV